MEKSKKPPRYKARIISGFTTLLLLLAVVFCLFITIQSMSQGYVQFFGHSLFRVVTGSMEPAIPVGTILLAQETPVEEIQVDDIVCFRSTNPGSSGMIVTHRVVGVYDTPDDIRCLRTKGDNNLSVDANPVTEQYLIGRIIWHTGDGSIMAGFISFITGENGFFVCLILPVLLIAAWIFRDAAKNLKREMLKVKESLEQQESVPAAFITAPEEYDQMVLRVREEVRKEMEQDARSYHAGGADDKNKFARAYSADGEDDKDNPAPFVERSGDAVVLAPSNETAPVEGNNDNNG